MPVLTFRDLSNEEIEALHQNDDEDEAESRVMESPKLALQDFDNESDCGEDDEIVFEGDEQSDAEDKAVRTDANGGRLVREARP